MQLRVITPRTLELVGFGLVMGVVALVVSPIYATLHGYGVHDWDQMQAQRYLLQKTIERYHQFPFWDPYTCGGHTWWGEPEGGTNVVPWLPLYLLFSLPVAIRLEITFAALLGAAGTWLFAGRFTRSPGGRVLVVALFAVSARWSQQIAMGHMWHLYYALTPWAFFFFDRALEDPPQAGRQPEGHSLEDPPQAGRQPEGHSLEDPPQAGRQPEGHSTASTKRREVVALAVVMALMVYTGAIYPLPQTVLLLAVYAAVLAVSTRSWKPFAKLAASGVLALMLAAPRLLPLLDSVRRFPRLIDSPENMDVIRFFAVFTQKADVPHPDVAWSWHEYGIYVGWVPLLMMLAALVTFKELRERALVYVGAVCLLLGFGRFSNWAPWAVLHDYVPIFKSQHVPVRWLYPGVLFLVLAAVTIIERHKTKWLERAKPGRGVWVEGAFLVAALLIALDVGLEARRALVSSFVRTAPFAESMRAFHSENHVPANLYYAEKDWVTPAMPAIMENVGVIDCGTFPGYHDQYRDSQGRAPGLGAHGAGDPAYRGEAYFATGDGTATITTWTPNEVAVHWDGAAIGDVLVLNQNWDVGWRAGPITGGAPAMNWADLVGTRTDATSGDAVFRYRPRFLWLGIALFALACLAISWKRVLRALPSKSH